MKLNFQGISTEIVTRYWQTKLDDDAQPIEQTISDGSGIPCRHCLQDVQAGEPYLILAHRPFPSKGAYSEMGPIFLHGNPCKAYAEHNHMPAMFHKRTTFLMRGYTRRHRIVYGTGGSVATSDIDSKAKALLDLEEVAYIHLRSGNYGCYQCKVVRG